MVFAASFIQPYTAEMAKNWLEANGVQCFLKDSHTVSIHHGLSPAIGGIKLMVNETELEKSLDLLEKGEFIDNQYRQMAMFQKQSKNIPKDILEIRKKKQRQRLMYVVCIALTFTLMVVLLNWYFDGL